MTAALERLGTWLALAAGPTFAAMAVLTHLSGRETGGMHHGAALTGMVPMYLLMSAFHLSAWLTLAARGMASDRRQAA